MVVAKRLYLSRADKVIGGVCGGLGEYFGIDPVFIRVAAVMLVFLHGIGLLGYLIAWVVMPKQPAAEVVVESQMESKVEFHSWNRYIPGAALVLIGLFFLLERHYWWWHMERLWPLLVIAAGVLLIAYSSGRVRAHKEGANESGQV